MHPGSDNRHGISGKAHRCDRRWPRLLCPGIYPRLARPPARSAALVATAQAGDDGRSRRVPRFLPAARGCFDYRFDAGGRADRAHLGNDVFTLDRRPRRQPDHRGTLALHREASSQRESRSTLKLSRGDGSGRRRRNDAGCDHPHVSGIPIGCPSRSIARQLSSCGASHRCPHRHDHQS